MVHWAFLILAFFIGAALCYWLVYTLAKVGSGVEKVIDEGAKDVIGRF